MGNRGEATPRMGLHPPAPLGPDEVVAVEVLRAAVRRHAQAMRSHSTARTVSEKDTTHRRVFAAARAIDTAVSDLCDILGEP